MERNGKKKRGIHGAHRWFTGSHHCKRIRTLLTGIQSRDKVLGLQRLKEKRGLAGGKDTVPTTVSWLERIRKRNRKRSSGKEKVGGL